jgi:hypothetical protein
MMGVIMYGPQEMKDEDRKECVELWVSKGHGTE